LGRIERARTARWIGIPKSSKKSRNMLYVDSFSSEVGSYTSTTKKIRR